MRGNYPAPMPTPLQMAVQGMCMFPLDSEQYTAAVSFADALLRHGAASSANVLDLVRLLQQRKPAAVEAFERMVRTHGAAPAPRPRRRCPCGSGRLYTAGGFLTTSTRPTLHLLLLLLRILLLLLRLLMFV